MKACTKCGEVKPFDAFYRRGTKYASSCKACQLAYRQAHPRSEYFKEYYATPQGKASVQRAIAASEAKYADRKAARNAVGNALRDGRLVPWPVCAVPDCSDKPVAHHPDYSRPLDVVWLCPPHHMEAHAIAQTKCPASPNPGSNQ
jgi:hypothetical protein